jgi:hypothetical protein
MPPVAPCAKGVQPLRRRTSLEHERIVVRDVLGLKMSVQGNVRGLD